MSTCKTCTYWSAPKTGCQAGDCASPKWIRGYINLALAGFTPDCASVEDDEGWGFQTGPDFGCIHWRAAHNTGSG